MSITRALLGAYQARSAEPNHTITSKRLFVDCRGESDNRAKRASFEYILILGIAAEDLGEKFEHFGKSTIDAQCDNRLFTTYYFRTKFKEEKYNDESRLRGIILGVTTTENVIHDCRILLKKILFLSL